MTRTDLIVAPGALEDYDTWLKKAKHGDVLVYWVGDLQHDRQLTFDEKDPALADRRKQIGSLNALARRVLNAATAGDLALTQKRLGENTFEYRATRLRDPNDFRKIVPARTRYVEPALD